MTAAPVGYLFGIAHGVVKDFLNRNVPDQMRPVLKKMRRPNNYGTNYRPRGQAATFNKRVNDREELGWRAP